MSSQQGDSKKRAGTSELQGPSPNRKAKVAKCSNTTEPPKATIMNNEILNMVLECLTPKDIARSSQVCKNWQKGIQQYTWKQTAINIKPEAFQALEIASGGKLSARALASGLSKTETAAPSPLELPDPTLKAEDLYVLVEVEIFGEKKAWCKSLGEAVKACDWEATEMDDKFVRVDLTDDCKTPQSLEIQIPANQRDQIVPPRRSRDFHDPAGALITEEVRVSMSLWRVDTGKMCRFCHQKEYNEPIFDGSNDFSVDFYFLSDEVVPVRKDIITFCCLKRYHYMLPEVRVRLDPLLPQPGSNDEPDFLKVAREEGEYSQEMIDFLAKGDTKYQMSDLKVEMRFSVLADDCANDNVESMRDFLLFIEGLDWQ